MKNPAKPGDFGTNGTRGVVLSGMSEDVEIGIVAGVLWLASLAAGELAVWLNSGSAGAMMSLVAVWLTVPAFIAVVAFIMRISTL